MLSLLDLYTSDCVLLVKTRVPDGIGGYKTTYVDGVTFSPAWEYMASTEVVQAEQAGTNRTYRIYVEKDFDLDYHEVFRRTEDQKTFRVINAGIDRATPSTSRLNRRVIEVEAWPIPD